MYNEEAVLRADWELWRHLGDEFLNRYMKSRSYWSRPAISKREREKVTLSISQTSMEQASESAMSYIKQFQWSGGGQGSAKKVKERWRCLSSSRSLGGKGKVQVHYEFDAGFADGFNDSRFFF